MADIPTNPGSPSDTPPPPEPGPTPPPAGPSAESPVPGATPAASAAKRRFLKTAPVIIVGSVMFSFISYWRVAAVVLCDMASTAFYIGGIVEQVIGPAAPWFIGAVMLFSFAMGAVYIESCSLFVRGGVYRVVKSALGTIPAKVAVSALLFDYILTGPISAVSAGQYLVGWLLEFIALTNPSLAVTDPHLRDVIKRSGAVVIAIAITLYFFRKNLIGLHESSGKALRIMFFTTSVAVIVLLWSGLTLFVRGPSNSVPTRPDLSKKIEYQVVKGVDRTKPDRDPAEEREMWLRDEQGRLVPLLDEQGRPVPKIDHVLGRQIDPLGFLPHVAPEISENIRHATGSTPLPAAPGAPGSTGAAGGTEATEPTGATGSVWSLFGLFGLIIAFGHSVLAMSGEETMAQVYREVESPKLPNFKKGALVIFTYAFVLTTSVSFLAVLIIPDEVRMKLYADNLLGGLAMNVIGPTWIRLVLNAVVVVAGSLILSGAVNTSIIGSNGVLNRVAEDGVLPERLQKPHPRFGTTYRMLYLIIGLQLFTIVATGGDMIMLGEAYAFGVLWSFTFMSISMLVLRFKDKRDREFRVPVNIRLAGVEIPLGLVFVTLVLSSAAVANLFTKELATITGLTFTAAFMVVFVLTERYMPHKVQGVTHEHLEQFTQQSTNEINMQTVGVKKPYRRLVAIRSPQNLYMLQKTLDETDPETTDVIVMTAKTQPPEGSAQDDIELDRYDRRLMTAVIELAERVGKPIKPLVVPTNNPLFAIINTARELQVQELVIGASNKFTAEEQLDQMAFYWINIHSGDAAPLTIRMLSKNWDVHYDVGGGRRIPKISERKARTVAELRAAGVGVRRVLLAHDGSPHASDVFETVLTMLDPDVVLDLVHVPLLEPVRDPALAAASSLDTDHERAEKLGRELEVYELTGDYGPGIVNLVREYDYQLIIVWTGSPHAEEEGTVPPWYEYLYEHAPCPICTLTLPAVPREVDLTPM